MAAKQDISARWAWACDDPRSFEPLGLRVLESVSLTRPPGALRRELPARYRYLLPLAGPILGKIMSMTLFRATVTERAGDATVAERAGDLRPMGNP